MNSIYEKAKSCLGQSVIPVGFNPEIGCAISVWTILNMCGITLGETPSTKTLQDEILADKRFEEVLESEATGGDIIMSATGTSTVVPAPILHGHTGILGLHGIMSNDSDTGLWREKWDLPSWKQFYGVRGGFTVRFFHVKVALPTN